MTPNPGPRSTRSPRLTVQKRSRKAILQVEILEDRRVLSTAASTMSSAEVQQLVQDIMAYLTAHHLVVADPSVTSVDTSSATTTISASAPAAQTPAATPTTTTAGTAASTATTTPSVPTVAQVSQPASTSTSAGSASSSTTSSTASTSSTGSATSVPVSTSTTTVSTTPAASQPTTTAVSAAVTGPTISGFVYNDVNNNGIMDPGEHGIPNSTIQLYTSSGTLVGTTTTDSNGHYVFSTNANVNGSGQTQTQTLNFPDTTTNWTQTQQLNKFDPSLGKLQSIEIINHGTVTSHIRVENLDHSSATVNAQASGTLALSGPGLSLTPLATTQLQPNDVAQSFHAASFDGSTDYTGNSGHDFGTHTATGSQSVTITDPNVLTQYTGTGTVNFTETASATSAASGPGNLQSLINSTASAQVTVIYHYAADNSLQPGNYILRQPKEPSGYLDGQDTAGNTTPLPGSVGNDTIDVTLGSTDSTNNNFGELKPASLGGFVYADANNDGIKQSGEAGIGGVTITLSGTDDTGDDVTLTRTTAANGSYVFNNLRPGNYTLKETQPANFFDGKDTIGSQGGTASDDQFSDINLSQGINGTNNNFGELPAASLSGFVYVDANNNGVKDSSEPPIPGVAIALTGTDDLGNSVSANTTTASDGSYHFAGLRPGSYTINETQPAGFQQGHNTVGSLGGTVNGDQFLVNVGTGATGTNYNFGEVQPPAVTSQGTPDQPSTQDIGVVTKRESLMLFWHRRGIQTTVDSL